MTLLLLLAAAAAQDRGGIIVDRDRLDRAQPAAPKPDAAAAPRGKTRVAAPHVTVPITGVQFVGVQAPGPVAKAAQNFLGKSTDTRTLQLLAAALSAAYGKSDVALYTVVIPEQDFAGGVVAVSLTEGRIARIDVKDAKRHLHLANTLAPLTAESPLSRPTMERRIMLARAIPGLTFDAAMADPDSNGALTMTVTPKQKKHKFSLGFSNRGVDLLGDGEFDAKAEFFGTAINGDDLAFGASTSSDFKQYRYYNGAYSAPIGSNGLTLGANAAYLETRPKGYPVSGRAKLAGLTLAYPLVRSVHRSADVSVGIDGIDNDDATLGNIIAREHTRAARVAVSWSDTREKRSVSVAGSLSKGLDILGARVTAPLSQTNFLKGVVQASAAQAIGKRAAIRLSASGQYSGNRLPAAERFAIGGGTIGRAFDTGLLTGDRGAGGLGEFAYRPVKAKDFAQSEVYTFVDGGVIGVLPRGPGQVRADYSLASAGIGFRARWKDKAEFGLEAARPIDSPYAGYDEKWRLSVEWRLSL